MRWHSRPMDIAVVDSVSSPPSVISATAVSKSWGSHSVFTDLTVEVPRGVTGLLGSNGSGKTTLLGMLLGLHHPDGGDLRILGEDPAHAGPELRQHIGYSPEHHDLPDDVAAQDLVRHIAQIHGLPRREATTRSSDALWLVGLGEERARPVGTKSTGQRQRVKLAQAIAHGPSIILLDEPTDGLDPVQRDDMLALIRRIGTEFEIDVLLSSHLLEEVERIADNVVIVADGTVRAAGPISELRSGRGGVIVQVADRSAELATALRSSGLEIDEQRDRILVGTTEAAEDLVDAVRDAVAAVQAPLRRLYPVEQSLEELFLTEVQDA